MTTNKMNMYVEIIVGSVYEVKLQARRIRKNPGCSGNH